jgi:hypothetical protein
VIFSASIWYTFTSGSGFSAFNISGMTYKYKSKHRDRSAHFCLCICVLCSPMSSITNSIRLCRLSTLWGGLFWCCDSAYSSNYVLNISIKTPYAVYISISARNNSNDQMISLIGFQFAGGQRRLGTRLAFQTLMKDSYISNLCAQYKVKIISINPEHAPENSDLLTRAAFVSNAC